MNTSGQTEMLAVRLYGPRDLRVDRLPVPAQPGAGEVLLQVTATSICGSDLHTYRDGRIGDTPLQGPLVLGHEFAGIVVQAAPDAHDGDDRPLSPGLRVAVDPAMPCFRCELCEKGHPNLCRRLHFCGLWPDDGSLRQLMLMPARSCFPLPEALSDADGALLEPLGIGLHAVDLGRVKVGDTVAILGAGPIGLMILQLVKLSGACPVLIADRFDWRLQLAKQLGADLTVDVARDDPISVLGRHTQARGADVVFEAAWADQSVGQAMELARLGGRVILVGIPSEDEFILPASPARRKGLTIKLARRMKHVYPRAIALAQRQQIKLRDLVSHVFPLDRSPEAFDLNARYAGGVVKIVIEYPR
ncbi:MAG: alcohol dehydrogenase catalytic domain-containing protein [Acidobacteriota bacterium]